MKTVQLIMMFLCCFAAQAQQPELTQEPEQAINRETETEFEKYLKTKQGFIIQVGAMIPMGNLADKISTSPELGFWSRCYINKNNMLDIGFSASMLSGTKTFDYQDEGGNYMAMPLGAAGMAGFRLVKVYQLSDGKHKSDIEWISSFGCGFFMYEDRYTASGSNQEEDSTVKGLSTFHLGQGARYTIDNLGLYVTYNYAPYGQFSSHVDNDFGASSLSVGIIYEP